MFVEWTYCTRLSTFNGPFDSAQHVPVCGCGILNTHFTQQHVPVCDCVKLSMVLFQPWTESKKYLKGPPKSLKMRTHLALTGPPEKKRTDMHLCTALNSVFFLAVRVGRAVTLFRCCRSARQGVLVCAGLP